MFDRGTSYPADAVNNPDCAVDPRRVMPCSGARRGRRRWSQTTLTRVATQDSQPQSLGSSELTGKEHNAAFVARLGHPSSWARPAGGTDHRDQSDHQADRSHEVAEPVGSHTFAPTTVESARRCRCGPGSPWSPACCSPWQLAPGSTRRSPPLCSPPLACQRARMRGGALRGIWHKPHPADRIGHFLTPALFAEAVTGFGEISSAVSTQSTSTDRRVRCVTASKPYWRKSVDTRPDSSLRLSSRQRPNGLFRGKAVSGDRPCAPPGPSRRCGNTTARYQHLLATQYVSQPLVPNA